MLLRFKDFLAESNRMAPLYHGTPASWAIDIIGEKMISAKTAHEHDRTFRRNVVAKRVVSLTRSLKFAKIWAKRKIIFTRSDGENDYVILELDQQALTHNYKFVPYNHFQDERHLGGELKPASRQMRDVIRDFPINQYEENVIGDIKNLPRYLKAVHVPKGIKSDYLKTIEAYKDNDGYNFEIKYLK